jgi:hypothetical protein
VSVITQPGEAVGVLRPGARMTLILYARHSWVAYGLWVRHALPGGRPRYSLGYLLAHHMESEGTKGYIFGRLRARCGRLEGLHLRRVAPPYDRRVSAPLVRLLGDHWGWFIVIRGRGPRSG